MSNVDGERLIEDMERAMAGEPEPAPREQPPRLTEPRLPNNPDPTVVPLRAGQTNQANQKLTTQQRIAKDCCSLPWREAEAMAKAIEEKQKAGGSTTSLVAAIQNWAWEWETFKEEERPKPAET